MPRTTTVHLLTGDYADRLESLGTAALMALKDDSPRTAIEAHPYETLRQEYDALKAEALEAGTTVSLTAVGRKVWRQLKEKHPPRTGEDVDAETQRQDRLAGVNADAVGDDLVYASVTFPAFKSRDAFDEWADGLSEGEWVEILGRAWELANGARLDPKELPDLPTRSES